MKTIFTLLLTFILTCTCSSSTHQDPTLIKKDQIYVEFITDCNWLIYGLRGKIKLHPQRENSVGFRTWQWYRIYGQIDYLGFVIHRNLDSRTRDYIVFPWSSYTAQFGAPVPNVPWSWDYVIHFNEMSGRGIPNAGTHMRVWGPCELVRLYHGEAWITHGDSSFYVKVDENDYLNYPPIEITLF